MNIIKCALQAGGIGIWKCWFFMEGGKPENRERNPPSKDENQQQTPPTYNTRTGNRKQRPHWWEASALTTAPSRLPIFIQLDI